MAGEFKQGSIKEKIYKKFLESTIKTIREDKNASQYGQFDSIGNFVVNEAGEELLRKMRQSCWDITDAVGDVFEYEDSDTFEEGAMLLYQDSSAQLHRIPITKLSSMVGQLAVERQTSPAEQTEIYSVDGHSLMFDGQHLTIDDIPVKCQIAEIAMHLSPESEDWKEIERMATVSKREAVEEAVGRMRGNYLSKKEEDVAEKTIKFLEGIQIGNFGAVFKQDSDGTTYLETDRLYVRLKAYFEELVVRKWQGASGNRVASNASCQFTKVYSIFGEDGTVVGYKCLFKKSDGDDAVDNDFEVGDLAFSKKTNSHGTRTYWRRVIEKDDNSDEQSHYIVLSNAPSEFLPGSAIPNAGDAVVQLGNDTDTTRQAAIIEYVNGDDSPAYKVYQNINTFSLEDCEQISLGYDSATQQAYLRVFGEAYIGARDKSSYMQYKNGMLEIKGIIKNSVIDDKNTTLADAMSSITGMAKQAEETAKRAEEKSLEAAANVGSSIIVSIFSDKGNIMNNGDGDITLTAFVYDNSDDITDQFGKSHFSWTRTSMDPENDKIWNQAHEGVGNVITVTKADIIRRCLFDCFVNTLNYKS